MSVLVKVMNDGRTPPAVVVSAARTILEYGLPKQTEISGPDGGAIQIQPVAEQVQAILDGKTDEELGIIDGLDGDDDDGA